MSERFMGLDGELFIINFHYNAVAGKLIIARLIIILPREMWPKGVEDIYCLLRCRWTCHRTEI